MAKANNLVFERTPLCATSTSKDFDLSRRQLTVLRLIDGVTPVSVFQVHLKSYDVPRLIEELTELGLIAQVSASERRSRNRDPEEQERVRNRHWRTIVATMLPSLFSGLAADVDEDALVKRRTEVALDELDDLDDTLQDDVTGGFEETGHVTSLEMNGADDDVSISLLSKYAPGLSDDLTEALASNSEVGGGK